MDIAAYRGSSQEITSMIRDMPNGVKFKLNKYHEYIRKNRRRALNDDVVQHCKRLHVDITEGKKFPLDINEKPAELQFIKTFYSYHILGAEYERDFLRKVSNVPIVTSTYTGPESGSLYGVGLIYEASHIIGAMPTDIGSTITTAKTAPRIEEIASLPQVANWKSLERASHIDVASQLNPGSWYPEVWIEGKPIAVAVRPYDSLVVRNCQQQSFSFSDSGRLVQALFLSRKFRLPIHILP